MEPVGKQTHLHKRGSRYYVRRKVPIDLVPVIGKREIKKSLGTADHQTACERARLRSAEIDAEFGDARRKAAARPATKLSKDDIRQLALLWFHEYETREAERDRSSEYDPRDRYELVRIMEQDQARLSNYDDTNILATVQGEVDNLLRSSNVDLSNESDGYWLLCELVNRGMIEAISRSIKRHQGDYGRESDDRFFAGSTADSPPPRPPVQISLTLGQLIQRYMDDPSRADLSKKTVDGYRIVFRVLEELLGSDKPVDQITREDFRQVRDVLLVLPPNASKFFPKLTLTEAARYAEARGLKTLSRNSVNSYLHNLSALFGYAVREQYISNNPAKGLAIRRTGNEPVSSKKPFTTDQLIKIFHAPLYVGCLDDERAYATPGPNKPRRGRFWVPLIALWMGMRLNECCQLAVDDVEVVDGTPVIHIRADTEDKRIKTESSQRLVPVHPELKRIGFLRYVEKIRTHGRTRLFPDLPIGQNEYYSDPFQKWFGRFLGNVGAKLEGTSFHSFRHNFRDALREANIGSDAVRALGGWKSVRIEEMYGAGLRASTLARQIKKISYPGLDLSHLYSDGG